MGKGTYDEIGGNSDPNQITQFTIGVIFSQIVGLVMIILSGVWMSKYHNGFSWDPSTVFNYHPLFMTMGMIFLYGDAILVYRLFRNVTKLHVKILHATIHVVVLVFASVALKAVFDSHNKASKPIPNLYSIHSWIGLIAVILFGLQWVCGFVSFLFPKLSDGVRRFYLPHHKYWGLFIFGMCCMAAFMGVTEKAIFSMPNGGYAQLPSEGVLANFFGLSILVYGGSITYLVTKYEYARPPEHSN